MLLALYVVLTIVKPIKLSNFEFTFEGFVLIVTGFIYGPYQAVFVGGIGSLLYQIFFSGYPFTATALLWVMPHMIAGLAVGLLAKSKLNKLEGIAPYVIAASVTITSTIFNTVAMYLDSIINKYSASYVLISLPSRIIVAIILTVIYGLLLPRLIKSIKKNK